MLLFGLIRCASYIASSARQLWRSRKRALHRSDKTDDDADQLPSALLNWSHKWVLHSHNGAEPNDRRGRQA